MEYSITNMFAEKIDENVYVLLCREQKRNSAKCLRWYRC